MVNGKGGKLTEFLCQVTLCSQLPLIVLIVFIALHGLAVVLQQGELGVNKRQLDGQPAGQSLHRIFERCAEKVKYTNNTLTLNVT